MTKTDSSCAVHVFLYTLSRVHSWPYSLPLPGNMQRSFTAHAHPILTTPYQKSACVWYRVVRYTHGRTSRQRAWHHSEFARLSYIDRSRVSQAILSWFLDVLRMSGTLDRLNEFCSPVSEFWVRNHWYGISSLLPCLQNYGIVYCVTRSSFLK